MLCTEGPVFEVVSGQILLGKLREFCDLHSEALLPMMREVGIEPYLLLLTQVGRYQRFLDVYRYSSLEEYGRRTDALLQDQRIVSYYSKVGMCIDGAIQVELAVEFPHSRGTLAPASSV